MVDIKKFRKALGSKYVYPIQPLGYISTRAPFLDYIIGHPGIPLSKLSIITGVEASGKTTLALQLAAQTQHQGGIVVYVDSEHKLDTDYATALGVDVEAMVLEQPQHMEAIYEFMAKTIEVASKFPSINIDSPMLVVWDSINATATKAELEGDWDAADMAPGARVMSRLLKKLLAAAAAKPISILFISQVRMSIGGGFTFTNKVGGGYAPKFLSALTIELSRKQGGMIKRSGVDIGNTVVARTIKSSISRPFQKCELDIIWGQGVDYWKSLYDLAAHLGIIEAKGAMYSLTWKGVEKKWGKRQAAFPEKNPKIIEYIQQQIDSKVRSA